MSTVKIIPLGGFDKIGMNMTLIECGDSIVAVDCGMSFPPTNMPGISGTIPDVSYLKENLAKFKGIVLTHGHEDHIGAIPYIIRELPVPIYGTPLTITLVEEKLSDFGIKGVKTRAIQAGKTIVVGDFKVEFIKTNHSIPDSVMLAFYTPEGVIVSTGDFKFDMSPIIGEKADMQRLSALGAKEVLAVLSDSTNAMIKGISKSEMDVYQQLDWFFSIYNKNRLIITTFASNMERIQQILNLGKKYNKKVAMEGEVMLRVFSAARKLGYMDIPEGVLIDAEDVGKYSDEEIVYLITGNHGESVQAISRIAAGEHPEIRIKKDDVVLFSSVAIQGDEAEFNRTLNMLEERGAIVEFGDIHATGHACAGELKLLFSLLQPKFVIPAHGEYRYRREAKKVACGVGISSGNVLLVRNGDVIELTADSCKVIGRIALEEVLIDGYEKSSVAHEILEERQKLSESGIVVVEICIDKKSGRYASGVNVSSKGFVELGKNPELKRRIQDVALSELSRFVNQGVRDERAERGVGEAVRALIADETGKDPIVVAFLTEVML